MELLWNAAWRLFSILRLAGVTPLNIVLIAAICGVFCFYPGFFARMLRRSQLLWDAVPNRAVSAIIIAAVFPLIVRLLLLPFMPPPLPHIEDEFSNLLAADTFSHWRLTNPTHPLWPFFETFHVFEQPTYMSMYPPLPGMVLAFGKIIFGHPWWGEFLSVGIMCGAVCWMLQAFLPAGWALLGSVAVGIEFGITFYWMNSYWGSTVAPVGACLLIGSVSRLLLPRHGTQGPALYGTLAGLGIAILANSRPWEGLVLSIATGGTVLYGLVSAKQAGARRAILRALLPCVIVLAIGALATTYYCWRLTGDPLLLPYQLDRNMYAVAPVFVWEQSRPAPSYHHEVMRRLYVGFEPSYQNADRQSTLRGWAREQPNRYRMVKDVFFGNFFTILLLLCSASLFRQPAARFLLFILALFLIGIGLQRYIAPHYIAPILGVAAALKMITLRRLHACRWRGKKLGQALAVSVVVCGTITLLRNAAAQPPQSDFALQRASIEKQLEAEQRPQLVIVRYASTHNVQEEWVYNAADIDAAKVVWARDMSEEQNTKLLNYFPDRTSWLLEPDVNPLHLKPYR